MSVAGHPPAIASFRELRAYIREDYAANQRAFWSAGFQALLVHRIGTWSNGTGSRLLRALMRRTHDFLNFFVRNFYGIELYRTTNIGRRVRILHQHGIVIHRRAVIGDDCLIRQGVTIGAAKPGSQGIRPPVLGKRVELGAGAVLVGEITIGDDTVIGPNAVVMTNVPAGSIVVAPPARIMTPPPRRRTAPQGASEHEGARPQLPETRA